MSAINYSVARNARERWRWWRISRRWVQIVGRGGGGGTVYVSGYTRANGTYVAGYTRSSSGGASRSSSAASGTRSSSVTSGYTSTASALTPGTSSGNVVHVKGYTRSDGTYVSSHTRASPRPTSESTTGGGANASTSATKTTTSKPDCGSKNGPGANKDANSADGNVVHVRSFTKADGKEVASHTRSRPGTKSDNRSSAEKGTYVDNALNRKLDRVGKPRGTCVVSKKNPTASTSGQEDEGAANKKEDAANQKEGTTTNDKKVRIFVDNPRNRRLGRVGKPIPPRKVKKKAERMNVIEEKTLEELRLLVENLRVTCSHDDWDYRYTAISAMDDMERAEVEEKWRGKNVDPETNFTQLSHVQLQGKIIQFDELQLEKKIGRGGFGKVYAAMWHGTPVAFKRFRHQHMSKRNQESFKMEVTVLAALSRPNVVQMFGAVVEAGNIGIVMEYMCHSLFHAIFVDEIEFSNEKKKAMVNQIVDAVHYLHTHDPKIAHCDIKSKNILLDKHDNAKLSDFGLSAMKNNAESSQSNMGGAVAAGRGTPHYSAPEVLRGEILKTDELFPADIYSLSMVIFEIVVEEEPFEDLRVRQLEENVGRGDLRPKLSATLVTQPVEDLLKRCWDADASKRPTAAEFQRIWSSIVELYKDC